MTQQPQRLYVDMDGTLAEFKQVAALEELYEHGYFRHLEPQINVLFAIREIIEEHPEVEVHILSSYLADSAFALDEKVEWLEEYLPELPPERRIFVPYGQPKENYIEGGVRPTDVLLDDYTHNLNGWCPPAIGVKLLNGINHTHASWQSHCVSYQRDSHDLAESILGIMRTGELVQDPKPLEQVVEQEEPKVDRVAFRLESGFLEVHSILEANSYSFYNQDYKFLYRDIHTDPEWTVYDVARDVLADGPVPPFADLSQYEQMDYDTFEKKAALENHPLRNTVVQAMTVAGFIYHFNDSTSENIIIQDKTTRYPFVFKTWAQAYDWVSKGNWQNKEQVQEILHGGEPAIYLGATNIKIAGVPHNIWKAIEETIINDTRYFLLEHEVYGKTGAKLIVDETGDFYLDGVWRGFSELQEYLEMTPDEQHDRRFGLTPFVTDDNEEDFEME